MPVDHSTVREIIEAAHQAVTESGVPESLQAIAFTKAFDYLAGDAPVPRTPPSGGDGRSNDSGPGGGNDVGDQRLDSDERRRAVAKRMGIDASKLAYVFEMDDDGVTLTVKRAKLASDRANASVELALLYASARQAGGYDASHTLQSAIRQIASDFGVLDGGNFSKSLAKRKDWFAARGPSKSKELKVTQGGYEEAGKIIERITAASGGGT